MAVTPALAARTDVERRLDDLLRNTLILGWYRAGQGHRISCRNGGPLITDSTAETAAFIDALADDQEVTHHD